MPQKSLMSHLKPVPPEFAEQWLPPEGEELPFQKVMRAGSETLAAKRRIQRTIWICLGVPIGFGIAWLPWFAWAAVATLALVWLVVTILDYNSTRLRQIEIEREAEKGIKIVEPRDEASDEAPKPKEVA